MLRKTLTILLCINLLILCGCSNMGTNRMQHVNLYSKRPPRDNQFIASGGYLKKNRRPVGAPSVSEPKETLFNRISKREPDKRKTFLDWLKSKNLIQSEKPMDTVEAAPAHDVEEVKEVEGNIAYKM